MDEFTEFLHEVFERLGPISTRRMFGGYMLYFERLPIGLVQGNTLYLKADDQNAADFQALGLSPVRL